MKTYKLQHLASGNCIIDEQEFTNEEAMDNYIEMLILPLWAEGDSIICNGEKRECFNDYYTTNRY